MPAGQRITGEDGIILLKDSDGVVIGEVPCLMSFTIDTSASIAERNVTCMKSNGDGGSEVEKKWTELTLESKSWSGSLEFLWQEDQTIPASVALDATNVGDQLEVELYPNDNIADKVVYTGKARIESVSIPSTITEEIKQSVNIKGDGALTKALVV